MAIFNSYVKLPEGNWFLTRLTVYGRCMYPSERGLQTNLQVGDTTLTGLMYHPTNMTILPSVGGWKTIFSSLKIELLSGFKNSGAVAIFSRAEGHI